MKTALGADERVDRPGDGAARPVEPTWLGAAHAATLAALAALVALGLAWELWLAPLGGRTLALKVLPLLGCLGGVWRRRLHTFRVLTLLVWLYVGEGLVRATSDPGASRWLAAIEVLLGLALFAASVAFVRAAPRASAARDAA